MDLSSIDDDDVDKNDNDGSIIDPAHKPHAHQLGEEALCAARRNPRRQTVALLPKIKLTPRRGSCGPLLVPSPGDDNGYDDRPTFPSNFSEAPTTLTSPFEMGDEEVIMAEMDLLLNRFGHHSARFGEGPEEGSGTRMLGGGGGLERVENKEAEMVALLNRGSCRILDPFCPPSLRRDRHHPSLRRPMPSITLNLKTIGGGASECRRGALASSPARCSLCRAGPGPCSTRRRTPSRASSLPAPSPRPPSRTSR